MSLTTYICSVRYVGTRDIYAPYLTRGAVDTYVLPNGDSLIHRYHISRRRQRHSHGTKKHATAEAQLELVFHRWGFCARRPSRKSSANVVCCELLHINCFWQFGRSHTPILSGDHKLTGIGSVHTYLLPSLTLFT